VFGFWIGNRFYWPVKHRNCNQHFRYFTHTIIHWNTYLYSQSNVFHQSSGESFQRRTFSFLWVPELSSCLSHNNFILNSHTSTTFWRRPTADLISLRHSRRLCLYNFPSPKSKSCLYYVTVSRPVCHGVSHSYVAHDHNVVTDIQLMFCWYGASSLTRGWVSSLQLLLSFASAVILEFQSHRKIFLIYFLLSRLW
jgi:hypothetical protein